MFCKDLTLNCVFTHANRKHVLLATDVKMLGTAMSGWGFCTVDSADGFHHKAFGTALQAQNEVGNVCHRQATDTVR